jgi:ribonuclease HI
MHKIYIYSDASFSKKHGIGIVSYMILDEKENLKKEKSFSVKEKNNIRIEFIALIKALKSLKPEKNTEIIVYTDCRAITNLLSRKEKLESRDFKSKNTGKVLSNIDIYKEFFKIYEKYKPTINWTKGHQAEKNKNTVQKNFSKVDKLSRKKLRSLIKKLV